MGSQRLKEDNYWFKLAVTLIHLALWAELGVITRTFLDKFLLLGCSGGWGPCLQGGIYFKDLGSNALGSFVIGLFAASSTLGLKNGKPLALLPRGHSWQDNLELQIGIRTGYCGCLTTFASWQLELMTEAIENNQWVNMLVGFIVGLYVALASYILGTHVALFVDRWVLAEREDVLSEGISYREVELGVIEGRLSLEGLSSGASAREVELERWEPDLPTVGPALQRLSMQRRSLRSSLEGGLRAGISPRGPNAPPEGGAADGGSARQAELERWDPELPTNAPTLHAMSLRQRRPASTRAAAAAGEAPAAAGANPLVSKLEDGVVAGAAANGGGSQPPPAAAGAGTGKPAPPPGTAASAGAAAAAAGELQQQEGEQVMETFMGNKTDLAALLALLALTAWLAVGTGIETRHTWLRQIWVESLLGPPGCTLRWWLSRFNYKLAGALAWFPVGTFVANMLATAIDFGLQCVLRRNSGLSYWGTLMLQAVQTGFCGSLSTVSTFVTEIVKFAELFPESLNAYTYSLLSIVGGALLGIALYGWAVWVPV